MRAPQLEVDGRVLRARALREGRRSQILVAARKVFADKGYHGGSIADIIEAAGIARGTFYLHFESKRAVFGEVLERLLEELNAVITRVEVGIDRSPYDQLVDNVERVLGVLTANADVTRILLRSGGGNDEELDQKVREFYEHAQGMIMESMKTGVEMGMVRDIDIRISSACVLGSIKETVDQLVLRPQEPAKKRARGGQLDRRAVAQKLLDYNLFGVLVRASGDLEQT